MPRGKVEPIVSTKECHTTQQVNKWGDLEDLRCSTATTAMLSEWKQMRLPDHCGPHIAAAIVTGTSSFTEMSTDRQSAGHGTWNQPMFSAIAPQPQIPEASE